MITDWTHLLALSAETVTVTSIWRLLHCETYVLGGWVTNMQLAKQVAKQLYPFTLR
jgi:hypothetical protein